MRNDRIILRNRLFRRKSQCIIRNIRQQCRMWPHIHTVLIPKNNPLILRIQKQRLLIDHPLTSFIVTIQFWLKLIDFHSGYHFTNLLK